MKNKQHIKRCPMCGGLSYLRRSFKNSPDDFVELSEYSRDGEESSEVHKEAGSN